MLENEIEGTPYPIDAFPSFFKELILELNKSLNYPIDYSATAILTAISATIGTSVKVEVKPPWYEYSSLYCCVIGNAGANKTHPINTAFFPLRIIDKINHTIYDSQQKEFDDYEKLSSDKKKKVKKVEKPKLRKNITTNLTTEALYKILNENPKGCVIVSDEMPALFENMSNYSKGNQDANYLGIWSNQPISVDRATKTSLYVETPFLSIIGGLQPRMLGITFSAQKLNSGFYQRFLFAYPDNVRKQPINDNVMSRDLLNQYEHFIKNYIDSHIINENNEVLNGRELKWTDESKCFFYDWNKKNADRVNEHQDSIKGEILSKYDNHFVRLALILQVMEDPNSCTIELKAVEGAEKLCNYYINCSFKVLGILQDPATYLKSNLPENKINFYNALPNEFSTGKAVELGLVYELAERRTKDFLKDEILFINTKHGFYKKKIIQK